MDTTHEFTVEPITHASFVMTLGGLTIFNDPVGEAARYSGFGVPDMILISHDHFDHFEAETLSDIATSGTVIIVPQAVYDKLPEQLAAQAVIMGNGDRHEVRGVTIEALPMYNLPEDPKAYHVKGRGNGYLLGSADARVYIAGDTAGIPEMLELTDIDHAFIPMNLPFTMSVEEAAEAVLAFAPAVAYPYHYRGSEGMSDVEEFKRLVESGNLAIKVELLNWYPVDGETGE